jgi:hypothetical protein
MSFPLVLDLVAPDALIVEGRVWRLCFQRDTWSVLAKKAGVRAKFDPPAHDDLVERKFLGQPSKRPLVGRHY